MRKENAKFNTKFVSEPGSYLYNADYFAFVELKDYACYVVADGIDTDDKKESAKLAVTAVISQFSESPGMSAGKLKKYMKIAHQTLLEEATEVRLEASIAIVVTDYKKVRWAHAGNSRIYWLRNGAVRSHTKDHSLTQRMVEQDELALDQISMHEERNNLFAYLGQNGHLEMEISKKYLLEDGDILLLETRGAWESIGDAELLDAIDGVSKPEEVCMGLEDVILSQQQGIVENYTIASIFVDKVYRNPKAGKNKKIIMLCVMIFILLFTVFGTAMFMNFRRNRANLKTMETYKEKGIEDMSQGNYQSAESEFSEAFKAAGKVKAKEDSTNAKKVGSVTAYYEAVVNINQAMGAMERGEFADASAKLQKVLQNLEKLKQDYNEDVVDYAYMMDGYQQFATYMYDGNSYIMINEYENAVLSFEKAAKAMEKIKDPTHNKEAKDAIDSTNATMHMMQGKKYEDEGDALAEKEEYVQTLDKYDSAHTEYMKARDLGNPAAESKVSSIETKIKDAQGSKKVLDENVDYQQAAALEEAGDKAMKEKKYAEAKDYYDQAKMKFSELQRDAKVSDLGSKISKCEAGPGIDTVNGHYLEALAMLGGVHLEWAEDYIYDDAGNEYPYSTATGLDGSAKTALVKLREVQREYEDIANTSEADVSVMLESVKSVIKMLESLTAVG